MNKTPEDKELLDSSFSEKDLDEYLRGDSEISQLYQSTLNQEPPSSLDKLILSKARAAVKKTPQRVTEPPKASFFSNLLNAWLVPTVSLASFAAVAVVVAVLISSPETGIDGDDNNIAARGSSTGTQTVSSVKKGQNIGTEGLQTSSHMTSKSADAEKWIKKIKALYAKGDLDGAKNSFKLFLEKYPKYPTTKLKQALQKTGLLKK